MSAISDIVIVFYIPCKFIKTSIPFITIPHPCCHVLRAIRYFRSTINIKTLFYTGGSGIEIHFFRLTVQDPEVHEHFSDPAMLSLS